MNAVLLRALVCFAFATAVAGAQSTETTIQLPGTALGSIATPSTTASQYFDSSSGTTVTELLNSAMKRNAQVLATRQRITETQGLLRQAGVRPNPGIVTSYGKGLPGSPGEQQFSIAYNHLLELGGKRQRRVDVARIGTKLAQLEIADQERILRANVRTSFGEALAAIRNLQIAEALVGITQRTYGVTKARVQQGESAALDQGLIEVDLGRFQSDETLAENQVVRSLLDLKPLVGMDPEASLRVKGDLKVAPLEISLEEARKRAETSRPDLEAARVDIELQEAEVRAAKAGAVPDLTLSGSFSRIDTRFDQYGLNTAGQQVPIRDSDNIASAGISINLPIRNRNQGNIEAAVSRLSAARLRLQYVNQVVQRDVDSAFSRYQAGLKALQFFQQRVLGQSQKNVNVILAAYTQGELRLFDVLVEERRLTDAQRAYTDVLRQYYLGIVELERAVGAPLQ